MGIHYKIDYIDVWGETHSVEIDEKELAHYTEETNNPLSAIFITTDQALIREYTDKLIKDSAFASRYISAVRNMIMTTGTFGKGFEGIRNAEEVLADQSSYISVLDHLTDILAGKLPNHPAYVHDEELRKMHIENHCKQILSFFPCWNVLGANK